MTDFEEVRSSELDDRRARAVEAEADAALVGDDVVLAERIRAMPPAIKSWEQMRDAHTIARARLNAGDYDDEDVETCRELHELARTSIVRLARRIVERHEWLTDQKVVGDD